MNENIYLRNKKIQRLEKKLNQSKILLNMIIHDMRNPTSSIKNGLELANLRLLENKKIIDEWNKFEQSCSLLSESLSSLCGNLGDETEHLDADQ